VSRAFRPASFADAARGVRALLGEPNARVQLAAGLAVVALGAWLGVDRRDWALLVLAIGLVLAAEAANTALEALADRVAPDAHPLVGKAKDVAAGGVLLASIAAAVLGLLVLGPPLWRRLF
jgi:diacylglycerol kinase (ATP)